MKNKGGSAFPVNTTLYERDGEVVDVHVDTDTGMSLRDYFATAALSKMDKYNAGRLQYEDKEYHELLARAAYAIADAMLAEREAA